MSRKVTGVRSKTKAGPSGATKVKSKKFEVPALSVPLKDLPLDPAIQKLKQKSVRRNVPPSEDIKKIREIIKELRGEPVTVQEFVGLVSPYTGDKGKDLKSVMEEDLASFRKMAKRVYDTMTQDVSDVLANEQIRMTDYFKERHTLNMDKMMRIIEEIYRYVPNFDFEMYYRGRKEYLNKLFPLPKVAELRDPEEIEMHNRQEAYHRLQWMRSEGIRLNQENVELQGRLRELKQLQKNVLMESRLREEEAEQRRNELELAQTQLQDHLENLNESMEKSIIENEEATRMIADAKLTQKPKGRSKSEGKRKQMVRKTQPWNVRAAQAIEQQGIEAATASGVSSVSVTSIVSKTGAVRKKARPKIKKRSTAPRDTSPFHYSPIKTPPPGPSSQRQTSPFHYSPPASPPRTQSSPFHYSPPREAAEASIPTRTVRMESTTTTVEQRAPSAEPISRRTNLAPKDTWGGFG